MQALPTFDNAHHEQFMDQGYLRLGNVLSPDELAALQQRIDDIMLGRVRYTSTCACRSSKKTAKYAAPWATRCRRSRTGASTT